MNIQEIRKANLTAEIEKIGRPTDFCRAKGIDPSYLSQILGGHRSFGEKSARNIELKIGLQPMALDRPVNTPLTQAESDAGHGGGALSASVFSTPKGRKIQNSIESLLASGVPEDAIIKSIEAIALALHGKSDAENKQEALIKRIKDKHADPDPTPE